MVLIGYLHDIRAVIITINWPVCHLEDLWFFRIACLCIEQFASGSMSVRSQSTVASRVDQDPGLCVYNFPGARLQIANHCLFSNGIRRLNIKS